MKIGFITNLTRDIDGILTKELINFVLDKGCTPILDTTIHCLFDEDMRESGVQLYNAYTGSDFLVVIGGDGTMLNAAQQAAYYNANLLGINSGNLGFLTDCNMSNAKESIINVINGKYTVEKRMMLDVIVNNNKTMLALNEALITKKDYSVTTIKTRLYINNDYINEYMSDGLIVSTPTGSTAYNLSAGGPILKPDTKMMTIVPVCCHDLHSRPLVVSSDEVIKVEIKSDNLPLVIDGMTCCNINKSDIVEIRASKIFTNIIKTNTMSYYDILRQKIIGEKI